MRKENGRSVRVRGMMQRVASEPVGGTRRRVEPTAFPRYRIEGGMPWHVKSGWYRAFCAPTQYGGLFIFTKNDIQGQ